MLALTTANQMDLLAQEKNLELTSAIEKGVEVEGDQARFRQVICAAHGGTVTVRNRENGGSCFTVELRLA